MIKKYVYGLLLMAFCGFSVNLSAYEAITKDADIVLKDVGIEVSRLELENAIKYWPSKLREDAVDNQDTRREMLSQFVMNKKIAKELERVTQESDSELYWKKEFAIRNLLNKLFLKNYKETIKVPDMTELAREKLLVNRDKYAKSPESRKASHILIKCSVGCDRKEKKLEVEKLLDQLRNGASFEEMVEKYSDDPGSKARKGVLTRWMRLGESRMDGYFVDGVYSIDEKGGYSEAIETRFGFHVIRLDDIKEATYKPDSEVLPELISALEKKYRDLSHLSYLQKLTLSKNAIVDNVVLDELLLPFKSKVKKKIEEKKPEKRGITIKKFIRE